MDFLPHLNPSKSTFVLSILLLNACIVYMHYKVTSCKCNDTTPVPAYLNNYAIFITAFTVFQVLLIIYGKYLFAIGVMASTATAFIVLAVKYVTSSIEYVKSIRDCVCKERYANIMHIATFSLSMIYVIFGVMLLFFMLQLFNLF